MVQIQCFACTCIRKQPVYVATDFPGGSDGKVFAAMRVTRVRSLGWEDPGRREWQLTPVFFSGESHGRRSLAGYSPRGRKELDTTERLHFHYKQKLLVTNIVTIGRKWTGMTMCFLVLLLLIPKYLGITFDACLISISIKNKM